MDELPEGTTSFSSSLEAITAIQSNLNYNSDSSRPINRFSTPPTVLALMRFSKYIILNFKLWGLFLYHSLSILSRLTLALLFALPKYLLFIGHELFPRVFASFGHGIVMFFYGSDPFLSNRIHIDANLDPLTDTIRRFPSHAAWFIKAAMLFGGITGICLSIPIMVYLNRFWATCAGCTKPLRWWLLFNCVLQGLQAPLRLCFVRCINTLLHPTVANAERSTSTDAADSDDLRDATIPNPNPRAVEQSFQVALNGPQVLGEHLTPQRSLDRHRARNQRRQELTHLSMQLVKLTNSRAWRLSVWLSVAAYAWFLAGIIWTFNSTGYCCEAGTSLESINGEDDEIEDPLDAEEGTFGGHQPDVRLLTIIVLIASIVRLAVVLILFFVSLPSRLFSDFPAVGPFMPQPRKLYALSAFRLFTQRLLNRHGTPDIALLHLREAFATFDLRDRYQDQHPNSSMVIHYWNAMEPHHIGQDINADGEYQDEDVELRPYLFSTLNNTVEADVESLSGDQDEFFTGRRRQEIDQNCRRGLPLSIVNRLPVMYYSKYVFPRALKSKDSLTNALAKIRSCNMSDSDKRLDVKCITEKKFSIHARHPVQFGTKSGPIKFQDIGTTQTTPLERNVITAKKNKTASIFRSLLPRLMRNSETAFSPNSPSEFGQLYFSRSSQPKCENTSKAKYRGLPVSPRPNSKSASLLPPWRRLNVGFNSTRQFKKNSSTSVSDTIDDSFVWTSELFAGHPLFTASCSICLDDFEENSEIRQLPCHHGFHRECIDTWLAQVDSCPLCHSSTLRLSSTSEIPRRRSPYNAISID